MTWIKPSFLWMMYRSGWATKPGQEHILATQITRDGFEWALHRHVSSGQLDTAQAALPAEQVYPLASSISVRIGATPAMPSPRRSPGMAAH